MRMMIIAAVAASGIALGACTTGPGAVVGGATGAAVGGLATGTLGGALVGGAVGALAGAVLVESTGGWCTYRYKGRTYRERCR
jgi:osmotically inducible lipoprotein OsmB